MEFQDEGLFTDRGFVPPFAVSARPNHAEYCRSWMEAGIDLLLRS